MLGAIALLLGRDAGEFPGGFPISVLCRVSQICYPRKAEHIPRCVSCETGSLSRTSLRTEIQLP